jgi:hypothetical protein
VFATTSASSADLVPRPALDLLNCVGVSACDAPYRTHMSADALVVDGVSRRYAAETVAPSASNKYSIDDARPYFAAQHTASNDVCASTTSLRCVPRLFRSISTSVSHKARNVASAVDARNARLLKHRTTLADDADDMRAHTRTASTFSASTASASHARQTRVDDASSSSSVSSVTTGTANDRARRRDAPTRLDATRHDATRHDATRLDATRDVDASRDVDARDIVCVRG